MKPVCHCELNNKGKPLGSLLVLKCFSSLNSRLQQIGTMAPNQVHAKRMQDLAEHVGTNITTVSATPTVKIMHAGASQSVPLPQSGLPVKHPSPPTNQLPPAPPPPAAQDGPPVGSCKPGTSMAESPEKQTSRVSTFLPALAMKNLVIKAFRSQPCCKSSSTTKINYTITTSPTRLMNESDHFVIVDKQHAQCHATIVISILLHAKLATHGTITSTLFIGPWCGVKKEGFSSRLTSQGCTKGNT